jgi:hypothetical protein
MPHRAPRRRTRIPAVDAKNELDAAAAIAADATLTPVSPRQRNRDRRARADDLASALTTSTV